MTNLQILKSKIHGLLARKKMPFLRGGFLFFINISLVVLIEIKDEEDTRNVLYDKKVVIRNVAGTGKLHFAKKYVVDPDDGDQLLKGVVVDYGFPRKPSNYIKPANVCNKNSHLQRFYKIAVPEIFAKFIVKLRR